MLLYCLGSLLFSTPAAMDMLPYLKEELGRPPGGETAEYEHNQDVVMPGFRFHPTEEELVEFYLRRKVEGKHFNIELITVLDLYRYDPWELPAFAAIGEKEWFFYVPRDRKYRNGDRPNRVTASGYWKATGADRMIRNDRSMRIGLKKTLVFYTGKAPKGKRTTWIMNEYRLPQNESEKPTKNELSLCRVYKKPGSEEERLQARRRQNEGAMKETSAITATTTDVIHCSPPEDPGTCKNHGDEQQQHQQQQMMIIMECSSSTDKSRSSSSKAAFTAATEEALAPLQGKYNYGLVTAPDRLLENMQEGLMCSSSVVGWNHHVQNQSSNDPVNLCLGSTSSGNIYPSVPVPVPPQSHATSTVAPAHHSFAQQIHGGSLLSFTSALPTEPSTTTHKLWDWTSPARGNGSMD